MIHLNTFSSGEPNDGISWLNWCNSIRQSVQKPNRNQAHLQYCQSVTEYHCVLQNVSSRQRRMPAFSFGIRHSPYCVATPDINTPDATATDQ